MLAALTALCLPAHPRSLLCLPCRDPHRAEGLLPTDCQWVDCSHFVSPASLQQHPRPHIGRAGGGSSSEVAAQPKHEPAAGEDAAAAGGGGAEAMEVDGVQPKQEPAAEPAAADFSSLLAAAAGAWAPSTGPAEAGQAKVAAQAKAAAAPDGVAVRCAVSGRFTHLRCFPPEFQQRLRSLSGQPCISSQEAMDVSTRLAAVCSAGLLPLGSIAEGARSGDGKDGGKDGEEPPAASLPLSLLVVRGAAVASPADCRGHAPAYNPEQRQQLQVALSAALRVVHRCGRLPAAALSSSSSGCLCLHTSGWGVLLALRRIPLRFLAGLLTPPICPIRSCYEPLPDSRTGADMLPWLLRGAVLAGGEADYSAMHSALLYAGPAVVGVGEPQDQTRVAGMAKMGAAGRQACVSMPGC